MFSPKPCSVWTWSLRSEMARYEDNRSMVLNIAKETAALERMRISELRTRYAEVFGERPRSGHRLWLMRRIAWRLQALAYGDLSQRARERALELANDADLRLTQPRKESGPVFGNVMRPMATAGDDRLPMPGTLIKRHYKGRTLLVEVLAEGFSFEGRVFPSLSAVAKAATGAHWNGFHFFGLANNKAATS